MEGAAFVQPRQATHLQTLVSASSCPRPVGGVLLGGLSRGLGARAAGAGCRGLFC